MSELGEDARDLIERALRDEANADAAELQRIRRRVLAAGAGASIFGSVGKALAVLGKASVGPAIKAFSVGVAVTVLALGIPTVLSSEKSSAPSEPRNSSVVPKPGERTLSADPLISRAPLEPPSAAVERAPQRAVPATRSPSAGIEPSQRALAPPADHVAEVVLREASDSNSVEPLPPVASPKVAAGASETYSAPSSAGLSRQSSPLVQEITLLEKVQSELRAGRGRAALELLDRSAAPAGGQLRAERLAAEVFAACQVSDVGRARAAARLFLNKYASSPASARVRGSCAGEQGENAR